MPLDSAAYLTSLGWQGTGNGLRKNGMAKPLAIPQKRTLSGVGKDRDEAFPFWDHVFNAAANSIKIKIHNDDSDQSEVESEQSNTPGLTLSRTSTGIISNRRPTSSTPIGGSGSITPQDDPNKSRLSLLAQAKRQAAYAKLYASFYKGPVIAPLKDESNLTVNEAEEETAEKTDTYDTTNNSLRKAKDSKNLSSDSSQKQKKRHSKCKSNNTEAYSFEEDEESLDEGKDKSTKRRRSKQKKLGEMDLSLEQDLDNKTDSERERKSDTTGEEAEESKRKRKDGSKRKKRPFEDGNDKPNKRKKSKSKTVTVVDDENTVTPKEHISRLNDSINSDEKRREKKSKKRKKERIY